MVNSIGARRLFLRYGSQTILDGIDISLVSGRIGALIGPNGAGKSSAFRIMAGLVKPDSGHAVADNSPLASLRSLRNFCGYLLETPDFYPYLSGKKNLELLIHLSGLHSNAAELLDMVGLTGDSGKKVQYYSKGMKQRLGLAQVLIGDPCFLILDEPFNGLDPEVREQMIALLITLRNRGKGIMVSTHLLEDIESIADDFTILHRGKVFLAGAMNDYRDNRQNVTLWFSKPLPGSLNREPGLSIKPNSIELLASIAETETLIQKLSGDGLFPYRVTRSGILHDKYMEMTR
jgi:ABC-2 type transport system ATP-binding protein